MPPSPQGTKGIKGHLLVEAAMRRSRDTNSAREAGRRANKRRVRETGRLWVLDIYSDFTQTK